MEAVRGTGVEVYMDSGVRLGTDALKALALGARAVFVGRPVIWGLAYKVEKQWNIFKWKYTTKRHVQIRFLLCFFFRYRECQG